MLGTRNFRNNLLPTLTRSIANPKTQFKPLDCFNMEEQLSREQVKVMKDTRQFADSFLRPRVLKAHRQQIFDRQIWREYGKRKMIAANLKSPLTAGISNTAYGLMIREVERIDSGFRSHLSVQSALVVNPIYNCGTESVKQKLLAKCISGEYIGSIAITEPDHGSDLSGMESYAQSDNSGGYILNGQKRWISFATQADVFVVFVKDRTNNNTPQGFVLTKGMPGISASLIEGKMALRTAISCDLRLQNVRVPAENKLTLPGLKMFLQSVNQARFGLSWGALGAGQACYKAALDYAFKRAQFGKSIASYQLVQARLAQMATDLSIVGQAVLRMGRLADQNRLPPTVINVVKRATCRKAVEVARSARQILGANGIIDEYEVMRHLANLETVSASQEQANSVEGTYDIQNLVIGRDITGHSAFN